MLIQQWAITRILGGAGRLAPPLLPRLPARVIAVRVRPEHVKTPAVSVDAHP